MRSLRCVTKFMPELAAPVLIASSVLALSLGYIVEALSYGCIAMTRVSQTKADQPNRLAESIHV